MVNSMTAFASSRGECPGGMLVLELRSYNHRYLDSNFRLPELFRGMEPKWREQIRGALSRGKIDCQLRWQATENTQRALSLNHQHLQRLLAAVEEVAKLQENLRPVSALELMQWPGVLDQSGDGEDEMQLLAGQLFTTALRELGEARTREGAKLADFILGRLTQIDAEVTKTREQMPQLLLHQRQRIERKLAEISADLEPARLEQELVILAQKTDLEEELDRLQAHIGEVQYVLKKGGVAGRRLDFLMQELNREANTLSAKSIASSTTQNAVELKVLIEQMREQIQNLE